jgi:AraC-like DNA-binding protein
MVNKTLYSDEEGNAVRYSAVKDWQGRVSFNGVAAKYVIAGKEEYEINGRPLIIKDHQYALGNTQSGAHVSIQSPREVFGLCVDISESLIRNVADYRCVPTDIVEFLCHDQLLVNRFSDTNNTLGRLLSELAQQVHPDGDLQLNEETFYQLAEAVVHDQQAIFNYHGKLQFKRQFTGQEVLRSLIEAKEFIDSSYNTTLDIDQMASQAGISRYHFSRLFRNVFGDSPYSYYNKLRLSAAREMLGKEMNATEVALACGFSDLPSFSKAFRKTYGQLPSEFKKAQFDNR